MTTQMDLLSDEELVELSRNGDREAFGRIVGRYQSLICALTYSATGDVARSEDLSQETFLAAWRALVNLKEPRSLKSWLCGIARHVIQESRRRAGRDPLRAAGSLDHSAIEAAPESAPAASLVVSEDEKALLWRVLEGLPENYCEPLVPVESTPTESTDSAGDPGDHRPRKQRTAEKGGGEA